MWVLFMILFCHPKLTGGEKALTSKMFLELGFNANFELRLVVAKIEH